MWVKIEDKRIGNILVITDSLSVDGGVIIRTILKNDYDGSCCVTQTFVPKKKTD